MSILKEFDKALVCLETQNSALSCGYTVLPGGKTYHAYLSNACWKKLLDGMDVRHKAQYDSGGGKELEEKDGKPPKMASFASSSRMVYMYSKSEPSFVFEKKLPTTVGGTANLDGYLELADRHIFVEAKCREPYSHKGEQIISQNYSEVYAYLREKLPRNFSCVMEPIPEKNDVPKKKNEMRTVFFCKGEIVSYFDIKQMICHLLGIATNLLKNPDIKSISFLYFLYDPSQLAMSAEDKNEVMLIYKATCRSAESFDFEKIFECIVDFLTEQKGISASVDTIAHLKRSFSFTLCSQNDYASHLK